MKRAVSSVPQTAASRSKTALPGAPSLLDQCGPTQRRLLEALLHRPEGLAVEGLTRELGITANAVRQHLAALLDDGLVRYEVVPASRGRPRHRYCLSDRGVEAFPRRYRELAEILLSELGEQLGNDALGGTMRRMGERAGRSVSAGAASVPATARVMKQLGYEAGARNTVKGGEEIVAFNCVFHRLAERFPGVCEFDLGFMESATGKKVEHRECMVRGGRCCRFGFTEK